MASSTPTPVTDELQAALVDLIALSLHVKQAHWHVTGRQFLPVHEQLDRIADDTREWADLVAERSVTLGVPVDGRPDAVASTTKVWPIADGLLEDEKVLRLVADEVEGVVWRRREALDVLGAHDPVTQDLVIEILRGLEKHLWMLRAPQAA